MELQRPLPVEDLDFVLDHTREIWRNLKGCRLFITGGTGFIGTWLLESILHVNKCLTADIETVVLTRRPTQYAERMPHVAADPKIRLWQGDVCSFEPPQGRFDIVIHAATDVGDPVKASDHLEILNVGVNGTRHVLDFAAASGARNFLLLSSGAVYGRQPPELARLPESWRGAPDTMEIGAAYGESKRVSEWLACAFAAQHGLQAKIARIFALIGPGMPLNGPFAAGNFIRDALLGKNIIIKGDGAPCRSYLYAADMTIWLWHMLLKGKSCEPYNLGSEELVSIHELALAVRQAVNPLLSLEVMQQRQADKLPPRYVPETQKARAVLGLQEYTPFTTALEKTIEWNRGLVR